MSTSQPFSLAALRQLLVNCGGIPSSMVLDDPDTSLVELGLDSSVLLALRVQIERTYGVTLLPEDFPKFDTLGNAVQLVNARLASH